LLIPSTIWYMDSKFFSIPTWGSMKLPSLEKESPLCLPHGKLPDPTLRPVTAK
jgi:hypothetical protein